eukprot:COSAG02_NODE_9976_length_2059_cov_2.705612_4_plen_83_part_00
MVTGAIAVQNPGAVTGCWIGLNDVETNGGFVWSDGAAVDFVAALAGASFFGCIGCITMEPVNQSSDRSVAMRSIRTGSLVEF